MKKFVIILLACCYLLGGLSAIAQNANLLENPGFEAPFNTVAGDPPREVAQGWTPWHIPAADGSPSFSNRQPEYGPTAPETNRILAGSDAQLITSFFATHDGGVLQRVTGITSGASLRFSVFAYVWSTTFDELNLSDSDGDVFVQVGIDPTGGTDPASSAIVWSAAGVEQYDAYNEYEVEAEAAGNAVTVFVRTTIGIPVKNNNIYLDQSSLTSGAEQPVPATNTPVTPSATPVTPSATPVTPSATPVTPSATPATPSATPITPTADTSLQLTATALIAQATNIVETATANAIATTNAQMTATASTEAEVTATEVPSSTPTEDTGAGMTATAIIDAATSTASANLTATAAVVTPTPTEEDDQSPISDEFPGTISHTVRSGESVYILAQLYGSSVDAIAEANGLNSNYLIHVNQVLIVPVKLPNPATSTPTLTPVVVVTATPDQGSNVTIPPTSNETYVVQRGDTLSRIAQRFNTNVATLAQINGIVNIDRIQAGQRLILPGAPADPNPPTVTPRPPSTQIYVVLPGDTLSRISLRFGVPMSRIAQANNIANWNRIFYGQRLIIPS